MAKKKEKPNQKMQVWIDARKRHHLRQDEKKARMSALRSEHTRKATLVNRFRKAKLLA